MKKLGLALLLASLACLSIPYAAASDEGVALSYTKNTPDEGVQKNLDLLLSWAKGELAEHIGEGLFDTRPEEKLLVEAMIEWAENLKRQAIAAKQAGDKATARVRYFSAEATARYAARMPHMLEDRAKH